MIVSTLAEPPPILRTEEYVVDLLEGYGLITSITTVNLQSLYGEGVISWCFPVCIPHPARFVSASVGAELCLIFCWFCRQSLLHLLNVSG